MSTFEGSAALVTGAAGGIGRAIATTFLSRGIAVGLADIRAVDLNGLADAVAGPRGTPRVRSYEVDARSSDSVRRCVDRAFTDLGDVAALVNCAGVSTSNLLVDVPDAEWDRVFEINTRGVFFFAREFARRRIAAGMGGRIVNISSQASKIGELGNGVYSASKAAVNSLTQVLGLELAPHGISVSAICPGYVDTEMMRKVFRERGPIEGMTPEAYAARLLSTVPTGRMVRPDELAGLVWYLCGDDASQITGVTLTMAGGRTLL